MAEIKSIDAKTLEAEALGFFKGKRKEQVENAEEKIMQLFKEEGMSIGQAQAVVGSVSHKLKKQVEILRASTTVE